MRILVVGGTGVIGYHAARRLAAAGHEVSLGARGAPAVGLGFPTVLGDYAGDGFAEADLARFGAVVFAAGQDVRHLRDADADEFWRTYQIEGVPRFVRRCREAGVSRFVHVGSYYHQVRPDLVATNAYVRARAMADELSRAEATAGFAVVTVNPPSVVGVAPGISARRFARLVDWLAGEPAATRPAPPGGTNFMSARSLAEAIAGAVEHGESGRAYLVGDADLSYAGYFQLIADAAGARVRVVERDENHPFLPDHMIVAGRGSAVYLTPDADERALLGYQVGDLWRGTCEAVAGARRAVA